LWAYSISGDLPIVLVRITDHEHLVLVRQMVQAHAYWRLKGVAVELIIWNEDSSGYRQVLQDEIMGVIATMSETNRLDQPCGIFVRRSEQMSEEDKILMQTVARLIVSDTDGSLADQVNRRPPIEVPVPMLFANKDKGVATAPSEAIPASAAHVERPDPGGVERHGRVHPGWPRVRHQDNERHAYARALGERACKPVFRHSRHRKRQRMHLVRERAQLPVDALAR
jgi:cellobiose phosphorylase